MSSLRKYALLALTCIFAVAGGASLASCADGSPTKSDAGADCPSCVAGEPPTQEGGTNCLASSDAGEPALPPGHVAFDGGVPLDEVGHALAVARCNYWGRCLSFAPYIVSECIDAITQSHNWSFASCRGSATNFTCVDTDLFTFPSAALFQAVGAGVVQYDPRQESSCLEALQAEGCVDWDPSTALAPCIAAFACASDGGAADAGCTGLLPGQTPLMSCSTDADCAGAVAPGGPHCVDGYCLATACGDALGVIDCASFVGIGQPCDSDPPGFGGTLFVDSPIRACSFGLTCKGLTTNPGADAGALGVCATPQDIGGACVEGTTVTGCMTGLVCPCGTCELPPTEGACVSDSCEVGVAYCDIPSGTCKPVKQLGSACTVIGVHECATDLTCDSATSTCQPYSP